MWTLKTIQQRLCTMARMDKTLPRIQNTSQDPKHFPESKNTSHNPKTLPTIQNTCFWDVFLDLGRVFGFWEVFLDSRTCFWILGRVLDILYLGFRSLKKTTNGVATVKMCA